MINVIVFAGAAYFLYAVETAMKGMDYYKWLLLKLMNAMLRMYTPAHRLLAGPMPSMLLAGGLLWTGCMPGEGEGLKLQRSALPPEATDVSLAPWATEALAYVRTHHMHTDKAILIDLGRHSGTYRLFVYDLQQKRILHKALVSHGCGLQGVWNSDQTKAAPAFSNTPDSHASSVGKYKMGKRGPSQWGIGVKYLLHGLEPTNSNALARAIVLHSWEAVPQQPVFPAGTPEGWGCPAVSNATMHYLDTLLQNADKPLLMWVRG